MSEDDKKLCLKALQILRSNRIIAGYTYDGIKKCIDDTDLIYESGDDVRRSPIQIVEEIQRSVMEHMNPYGLSTEECYILALFGRIKAAMRDEGYGGDAPDIYVGKWISTADRLPAKGDMCVICCDIIGRMNYALGWFDGETFGSSEWGQVHVDDVEYWYAVPERMDK